LGFPRFLPALYILYQPIMNAKIKVQYSLKYDPVTLEYIK
jgi:hypothetical protein